MTYTTLQSLMTNTLNNIATEFKFVSQSTTSIENLNELRAKHLGKDSRLAYVMKGMRYLHDDARSDVGNRINSIKEQIEDLFQKRSLQLAKSSEIVKGIDD